ncbi:adenine-specific DNA-methyltransferase [Bathymodiolus platifrons methanotrophic gill symbiont]|uniref:site-specific DNA-methyltransferase n=2 Tax=Bathymodiolus platifrons methanotrophic gill symbiont TaxID=113268 RepID=UPI001B5FFD54|nr:adenine-specific DNA-methyltransferase [Bathymodiolus platifrons methanotrophic gill symbiont]
MIEKLKMQTPNITEQNMEQIAKLFPNVMTETQDKNGEVQKAIDFDLLKQSLSSVLVDDADERYRLDWPGKKAALLKANTPVTKTLRPCRDDSVNFDSTENVYIEGDNFEVLKILQESYLGKIKMIYIDPPYNTGKDFIYKDTTQIKKAEYEEKLGATDEEDNKLFKNTDSNGRFHSDWLSMMYERLIVARDLLKDDGVIFISIDDNEVHNLREICDEVFGEENALEQMIWKKRYQGAKEKHLVAVHEYIFVYSKVKESIREIYVPATQEYIDRYYTHKDENYNSRGGYRTQPLEAGKSMDSRDNLTFSFEAPNGKLISPKRQWIWSKERVLDAIDHGEIGFTKDKYSPYIKQYLKDRKGVVRKTKKQTIIDNVYTQNGTKEMNDIFENLGIFPFPKPSFLLSQLIEFANTNKNDLILDFFSGSATTAHAVMQLNAEDKGTRKFIMVQLPEATDEKSEAYKAGYKNIAEIGKERIRRAGTNIVEDNQNKIGIDKLDIGFRVYKTDSSNMEEVYYHPEQLSQDNLFSLASNIKKERTPDDLLTQVILDLGLELNLPIEQKKMHGNNVFIVQTNALVACFDDNINIKIIDEIAQLKPFKVVFKDGSFSNSKDRINLEERFKRLSPETLITVI